ncbi:protein LTO1 homolog [Anguilla rostrata]|uniref:protein LTO1 homolog n=1 Tax=Anguilla rostrata TaxID=7938 RepID=UPI0030CA6402
MNWESGSEDPFDSIFMADNRFHCEAYREGLAEGTRQGLLEGMSHGKMHGARLSAEMSFYYGFAFAWKCLLQNNTDAKSRKRLRALEALAEHVQAFPHDDPRHASLQPDVEKARAKFRQVCSMMNVPADFREYVTVATGMSF